MAQPPNEFDLDHLILALSDAFDLVGVDRLGHCRRVAMMAALIAEELGWEDEDNAALIRAALLHDCGVSTTGEHHDLMGTLRWGDAAEHCGRGAEYLAAIPELAEFAPVVAAHHSPWSELSNARLTPAVANAANLVCLADRVDALRSRGTPSGRDIIATLDQHRGFFAPQFLAALDRVIRREAFWFVQDEPALGEELARRLATVTPRSLGLVEVLRLAGVVGRIIDRKSTYTERHSLGVGRVCRLLGRVLGLNAPVLDGLEIAGLLHDIGKLRIPDELLDKQGALNAAERLRMARHAFDTHVILTHAFGPGGIADWAGFHHECLSGNGYPFHLGEGDLGIEARIVAVADVFQALAQHRPYRAPLDTDEIAALMDGMVFAGKLDRAVVAACKEHMGECWSAATRGDDPPAVG